MAPLRDHQTELFSLAWLPRLLASSSLRPLLYLAIFGVAFLPRALMLDAYVAPDEGKWIYRSAHFLQALLKGDPAQMTSIAATPEVEVLAPAVPTMWTGALGLAAKFWVDDNPHSATLIDYLSAIPAATEKIPLDVYPWARFPTVLMTGLAVLAFYFLLSRLMGAGAAVLAALLLALDPFFIGLSRVIHHDALVAIFIVFSLLTLLLYRQEAKVGPMNLSLKSPLIWLIASGGAGGLALLTKPTALYLVIFVGLFLWLENGWPRRRADWQRAAVESLSWGFIALVTFVVFWPALWVAPLQTLAGLLDRSANAMSESNNYALIPAPNTPLPELGFLFYPVNWLFKSTPPVLFGLAALLIGLWQGWLKPQPIAYRTQVSVSAGEPMAEPTNELSRSRAQPPLGSLPAPERSLSRARFTYHNPRLWLLKWLSLFCLLFLLLLIPADTRDIRYFLPAHLALHPLAAIGILLGASRLRPPRPSPEPKVPLRSISPGAWLIGLLLTIQLGLSLIYFPYFVDYLNPIVGGPGLGPHLIKIGSGEGLDQMGRYLNQKPSAKSLRVATSFWESFVPFFSGRYTKPHYDEEADYILIYLRQIQNNNPFPEYWAYFSARSPEYTVSLVGLDYAWLYPGPQLRIVRDADFGDGLALRGYRLDRPAAQPGQSAHLTLVWAGATPAQANKQVQVQLLDAAGRLWAEDSSSLLAPNGPSPVEGHYQLDIPADMPRGDYPLWVSLNNLSHRAGTIPVRQFDKPAVQIPASINFGDLILFGGADINSLPGGKKGGSIEIKLLWQARQPIAQSYTTFVHLVDDGGNIWGQVDRIPQPGSSDLPTNHWEPAEWIVDSFRLSLKPDTPAGTYTLLAGWYNVQTLERLSIVGEVEPQTAVEVTSISVP